MPSSVMLFHRHNDVYTEFICLNAGVKSSIDVYGLNNYFVIKIEFIIYHKEKGRLNISDGLCFEASISYRSVSNVDQESQYGYCGSNGGYH